MRPVKVVATVLGSLLIGVVPVLAQDKSSPYKLSIPNLAGSGNRHQGPAKPGLTPDASSLPPESPAIVLQTFATPLENGPKPFYRLSPRELWHKAGRIYETALAQSQRLFETGQPMLIDRDGIYYQRDLYFYTKGVILQNLFDGTLDVGLYHRRYAQTSTTVTGRPLYDAGGYRQGESYVFSGGRQIYVGVRLDVGKLLKKR
jgi:hypothetical protein